MDKDSKMIFEAYAASENPNSVRVCAWCQKDHPELVDLHRPEALTHGMCKRHTIMQVKEVFRLNPKMSPELAQQKLHKIQNLPDDQFCPDLEAISASAPD